MRLGLILATVALAAALAAAQATTPSGFGRMIYSGTGGPGTTGGGGFGRIIYPGTGAPAAVRPDARGFYSNPPAPVPHQNHSRSAIVPYPIFYGGGYYSSFDIPQAAQPEDRDRRAPIVIINQNYQPEPVNPVMRDYSSAALPPAAPRVERAPVDPHAEDPTLYQIAMTDGTIFEAVGYWVEGDVLHYLTLEGNNNLATLDLVDRERSLRLNQERKVAFKLPKR